MPVATDTIGSVIRYGKHKIPRFIYHMTNKSNYESMLADGMIQARGDDFFGQGVYAAELTNLFKRWRKDKCWGFDSLQEEIVKHIAKGKDDIVILKIPTANLNHKYLKIRSLNRLFGRINGEKISQQGDEVLAKVDNSGLMGRKRERLERRLIFDLLEKVEGRQYAEHVVVGSPATQARFFTQKKEAIEYVYRDSIPISDVEKIGEVNVAELRQTAEYDPIRPMRSIFSALLRGTPEEKGALLLNC